MMLFKKGVFFTLYQGKHPYILIYLYKLLHHRAHVGYNEYEVKKGIQLVDIRCLDMLSHAFMNKYHFCNI